MRKPQFTAVCLSAICLISAPVRAIEPPPPGLLGMPNAFAGFQGTTSFTSGAFSADLHYAAFPLGQYPLAQDPSNGLQNVYAYQLFVTSGEVVSFSVGLEDGSGASNETSDAVNGVAGGIAPNGSPALEINGGSSFIAAFNSPGQLTAGTHSTVLLFTSLNDPIFKPTSVVGGGMGDGSTAPSPLPEPGSMALFGIAGLALLRRRRSSR